MFDLTFVPYLLFGTGHLMITAMFSFDRSWKKTDAANNYLLHVRRATARFSTTALRLTDSVSSRCIFGSTILNTVYEYFIIY